MKAPVSLKFLLEQYGYSERTVEEIWKWYGIQSSNLEIDNAYKGLSHKTRQGLRWIYGTSLK